MPRPDNPVLEVRCSETGKPMPKIPQWLANVNVKFVSDEAKQRHSPAMIPPIIIDLKDEEEEPLSDAREPSVDDRIHKILPIDDVILDEEEEEDEDDVEIVGDIVEVEK